MSVEFSRQENWSGLPFPSPRDLCDRGIEPGSLALQADSLPSEPPGNNHWELLKNPRGLLIGTADSSSLGENSGEGNGIPLQYSCLENPTDEGAWWAAVHGVAKSQT